MPLTDCVPLNFVVDKVRYPDSAVLEVGPNKSITVKHPEHVEEPTTPVVAPCHARKLTPPKQTRNPVPDQIEVVVTWKDYHFATRGFWTSV
jgi:hypothetical protein